RQVMHDEPARPRKVNPAVPRDLETVVLKAIAREPAHRYQTPAEMAEDLKRFVEDRPVRARRISEGERLWGWGRRHPLAAGWLAGIVLVCLAGFAGVSWQWRAAVTAREDEKSQRNRAEVLRRGAEEQAEESRRRLVRFQVDSGARLVEQGDLLGALPRFAEALRLDPDDAARAETHRLRLAATLRRSPRLVALWAAEAGWGRATFDPAGRLVASANLAVPAPPFPLTAPPGK